MSQQPVQQQGSTAKWLAIMVVMIAVIILGIWIYQWIRWIIYGMIVLLVVIPLFLNRKWVSKIISYIRGMYKKHTALGVLGTIGAVVGFLPFSAFLLGKTIWEYFRPKSAKAKAPASILDDIMPIEKTVAPTEEIISNPDISFPKDVDSKFPPTEQ